jgi:DNA-binding transcriptional MerR regulator
LRRSSILTGKRVGFNLDDIGEMLALFDLHDGAPSAGAERQLSHALSLFDSRIGDLERQRADLESSIEELRRGRAQVEVAMAKRGHKIPQGSNGRRMIGYGLMPAED